MPTHAAGPHKQGLLSTGECYVVSNGVILVSRFEFANGLSL